MSLPKENRLDEEKSKIIFKNALLQCKAEYIRGRNKSYQERVDANRRQIEKERYRKLAKLDEKGEAEIKQKNLAVRKQIEEKIKELERKNLKKALASERAYQRTMEANELFKLDTRRRLHEKDQKLKERLLNLKHNRHRESNPELQEPDDCMISNVQKLSSRNSLQVKEEYIKHDFKNEIEKFLETKPQKSCSRILQRKDSKSSLDNIFQASLSKHKKTLKERSIERLYKVEVKKFKHKIPALESYSKAKKAEEEAALSLKTIRNLQRKLNSVCVSKDNRDTFGGTSERKLPFEGKKESVMNMQECVKIDKIEQTLKAKNGCETAIQYLKLRETKDKDIAMTLANKVHCNDPISFKSIGRDGFEFLYESQMKNNDKEFAMVVDRIKKNIPNTDVQKYSKTRRMKSNDLFRDHNEKPYTKAPDHFYYQNKEDKNEFIQESNEAEKYIEDLITEESQYSDPGAELSDDLAEVKKIMRRHQSMQQLSNEEGEKDILNAVKVLKNSPYGSKMSFTKLFKNILKATRKKKASDKRKKKPDHKKRSLIEDDEEMMTKSQIQELRKAKIIENFIRQIPSNKKSIIRQKIQKSILHPTTWIRIFLEEEKRKHEFIQRQVENNKKQEVSLGKLSMHQESKQKSVMKSRMDMMKRFAPLLSQSTLTNKLFNSKKSLLGLSDFHKDHNKDTRDKMVKQLEERLKKAEENKKKLEKISLQPTIMHTTTVTERLKNFNKIQEEAYSQNKAEYEQRILSKKKRLSNPY
ncbi:unnamed protein product [Moneuplotes crassus]|uniref:Uncharacterized protein n=1 Tax=Euplotes crassus TaxID=5936 RepID=A0AAD1Y4F0_EUPCR|nr:unnamed protein product [Moneuplotes crassus]